MRTVKDTLYGDMTGQKYTGGQFNISKEKLTSLEGSPKECIGFYCSDNNLTNLIGGPEIVQGDYVCQRNKKLTSLEGGPKSCNTFYADKCPITNVKEQIIKYQIKAELYFFTGEEGKLRFSDIEKEFNDYALNKRVTRTSMRTLLGLDK